MCTHILIILLLEQIKWRQHLFLGIRLFRFCLQRNTVLKTKETLKVFPLSDRLAVENSKFSWRDERDMMIHERF